MRDYRIRSSSGEIVLGGSALSIKAESLSLGDFSKGEVRDLLGQHAEESGQAISDGAMAEVWQLTRGQPWLVNALAYEACFRNKAARDWSRPIELETVRQARERLVLQCDTHLDQLVDKLREPCVQRVIEPLLSGGLPCLRDDDVACARDLGLVALQAPLAIASPICREVIPRQLASDVSETLVPGVLPGELEALGGPLRIQGGRPATAAAGVPAADREQRGPDRAGSTAWGGCARTCWWSGRWPAGARGRTGIRESSSSASCCMAASRQPWQRVCARRAPTWSAPAATRATS